MSSTLKDVEGFVGSAIAFVRDMGASGKLLLTLMLGSLGMAASFWCTNEIWLRLTCCAGLATFARAAWALDLSSGGEQGELWFRTGAGCAGLAFTGWQWTYLQMLDWWFLGR